MPCFKGFAVSVHSPEGPMAEYSVQKQARLSRIGSYITVPKAKINRVTGLPEQSTFAISITLLTPGTPVPYSRPKPTPQNPYPHPQIVAVQPGASGPPLGYSHTVPAYTPLTVNDNETVAAYIYFDGRPKEEVATLLRCGVETWVNSRWVSVPQAEGGGLAEREFLFREVGLERWLNGLDLAGQNKEKAEARIQKRKERLEKRRRKQSIKQEDSSDEDNEGSSLRRARPVERHGVLRYGDNGENPIEALPGDDILASGDESDDMPEPEASGQIKVALYRVLASGEVKKGEYSPQFDAHDGDDGMGEQNGDADATVEHSTGLAQPKTLDPKSISTQTVTGIDAPDKPYAVFTFMYRGEKQLRKMGVLAPLSPELAAKPTSNARKTSRQLDFGKLQPLKSTKGTVGFTGYRDLETTTSTFDVNGTSTKSKDADEMESDDDETDLTGKRKKSIVDVDGEIDAENKIQLSQEEVARRSALAEGLQKIKLKRGHLDDDDDEPAFEPKQESPESDGLTHADVMSGKVNLDAFTPSKSPSLPNSFSNPSRLDDIKSDPTDTNTPRAAKKHRASLNAYEFSNLGGHLPSELTASGNAAALPPTPKLNGISPTSEQAKPNGATSPGILSGIFKGNMAATSSMAPVSDPADVAVVNKAQKEWEEQAKANDKDVTAFVGGDNGVSPTSQPQDDAAQVALPDESMDDEL